MRVVLCYTLSRQDKTILRTDGGGSKRTERNGFVARKDNRGRNLRTGESQRKDGLYIYRYKDERTGRRLAVYSPDMAELQTTYNQEEREQAKRGSRKRCLIFSLTS